MILKFFFFMSFNSKLIDKNSFDTVSNEGISIRGNAMSCSLRIFP